MKTKKKNHFEIPFPPPPPPLPPQTNHSSQKQVDLTPILNRLSPEIKTEPKKIEIPFRDRSSNSRMKRIVVISDTHNNHQSKEIPDGDILLHCGDLTENSTAPELESVTQWIHNLPHKHKIIICGNHEDSVAIRHRFHASSIAHKVFRADGKSVIYLQDEMVEIEGLRIYGTPWTPPCIDLPQKDAAWYLMPPGRKQKFAQIPSEGDVDILMTHTPPHGILDSNQGCPVLRREVLDRVKPPIHVFGHAHQPYGVSYAQNKGETTFINVAVDRTEQPMYFDYYY
eukprot:gb/GECH01014383.1/.p1 GENE.gb/GECH01014383.1/~~gb/GECH01014383.1/.p1  ORF type:complete len:283 (+),score=77.43 gb/GECH01014383.1/:1-849(+)